MTFIKSFSLLKVRNINPIEVTNTVGKNGALQHFIITGRNGTGKTTILKALRREIAFFKQYHPSTIQSTRERYRVAVEKSAALPEEQRAELLKKTLSDNGQVSYQEVALNVLGVLDENLLVVYFDSKRISSPVVPQGPSIFAKANTKELEPKAGAYIVQYLVNLWTEKAYANVDADLTRVFAIDVWFERLVAQLRVLFEDQTLTLEFDRKRFKFWVIQKGKERYSLNELSDGMSSAFSIVSELIMRMHSDDDDDLVDFNRPGIVIIDEIETHLHVSLQKLILPFLINLFPRVQFIVTTHSPFVLTSLANSCILDLDRGEVFSDLSSYSYEAVLEDFLDVDQYSESLKLQISNIRELIDRNELEKAKSMILSIQEKSGLMTGDSNSTSPELDLMLQRLLLDVRVRGARQ